MIDTLTAHTLAFKEEKHRLFFPMHDFSRRRRDRGHRARIWACEPYSNLSHPQSTRAVPLSQTRSGETGVGCLAQLGEFMSKTKCAICGSSSTRPYFQVKNSPMLQNVLYETAELARAAPTVTADFWGCENCLFLFNPGFVEPSYSGEYNNDQSLSPTYRDHLRAVVAFLTDALHKPATVLEIGCGNGLVLSMLHNQGYEVQGYDPAHAAGLRYVERGPWRPSEKTYDAVLFRHTLEGISGFEHLLVDVSQKLKPDGLVYVEFTNSRNIVERGSTVTLYHECAQYFSEGALSLFFSKLGMFMIAMRQFFGGDITAMIMKRSRMHPPQGASFEKLAGYSNVHIWGVSGRTIHFLTNYADRLERVRFGVDLDPRKQGKYVPFTGQKILSPVDCVSSRPDAVIVLNEYYAQEIAALFPYPVAILTAKDFYGGE